MERGIIPSAMIGHSVGEFVAATIAGTFTLADALTLVERRGALMQAQPGGSMLSVMLPWDELLARLPPELSLAAENAPGSCVVSGPSPSVAAWKRRLDDEGVACRELRTSHAFHSAMMEPVVAPFRTLVAAATRSAPTIPIVSGSSGEWLDAATATSPDYWARHLRHPVRFAAALARVLDEPGRVLLEVGPRSTLCTLARQHPLAKSSQAVAIASLADSVESEAASLRGAAGRLWCAGAALDPAGFDRRLRRRRLLLPTYPFERQRFWVEAAADVAASPPIAASVEQESSMHESSVTGSVADASVAVVASQPTVPVAGVLDRLLELLRGATGLEWSADDHRRSFVELGLDSLMLTQVSMQLQKRFNARVSFRQLMGDHSTVERLAILLAASAVSAEPASPAKPEAPMPEPIPAKRPAQRLTRPAVAGARLGRDPDGMPAWFVPHPDLPGKFMRIET
jgi:acyl transferase domain-containing protein